MWSDIPSLALQFRVRWLCVQQRAPYVLVLALLLSLSGLSVRVSAQTDGACPQSGPVLGTDGNFYGITSKGGPGDAGVFYKYIPGVGTTVLHSFGVSFAAAALTAGTDGNIYGTAFTVGNSNLVTLLGLVFKVTPQGQFTALYGFSGNADGAFPNGVTPGKDGKLYGTTWSGSNSSKFGIVFKLSMTGNFVKIYAFQNGSDGAYPTAKLVMGTDGNFYGTTSGRGPKQGTAKHGTVFKITPQGQFTTLYTFAGGNDGGDPYVLTLGSDGNFYGTTQSGGAHGSGTVFKVTPQGQLTTLYAFTGSAPHTRLTFGQDGNLYGTMSGTGSVFRVTPQGQFTTVYTFSGSSDGGGPQSTLRLGTDGNLYGATYYGGVYAGGTLFQVTTAGVLTTLHAFNGGTDASSPTAFALGTDGNFYGATSYDGGGNYSGTIFQITPGGLFTTLCALTSAKYLDYPNSLTAGSDGNLYGTTTGNTIFQVTPKGQFTTLYTFTGGTDGTAPTGLTLGSDGNFYGTTGSSSSGAPNGTVFKITPQGQFTTLYTFTGAKDGGGPNALILGSDGNFHGTCGYCNTSGQGTVFQVTPQGQLTTFYRFKGGADGGSPNALMQGSDGNFYGTTISGGVRVSAVSYGTVFKITPAGKFATIYTFTGGSDDCNPEAALTLGSDGNFYGTTSGVSLYNKGTVFKITSLGALTTLASFEAGRSVGALVQGQDGAFYGITDEGLLLGSVYRITSDGHFTTLYIF